MTDDWYSVYLQDVTHPVTVLGEPRRFNESIIATALRLARRRNTERILNALGTQAPMHMAGMRRTD